MYKNRLAALVACIALVGGIAWAAMESQTIGLPGGACGVDALLVPGAEGSDVVLAANEWSEEIDFRVGFEPDGTIMVNGEAVGATDVSHTHSVHVDVVQTSTGYEANVTVKDEDLGLVVAMKFGVGLGIDAPKQARAQGQSVLSLSAE